MGSEGSEGNLAGKESGQGAGGCEGANDLLAPSLWLCPKAGGARGSGRPVACASFPTVAGASFWLLNLV